MRLERPTSRLSWRITRNPRSTQGVDEGGRPRREVLIPPGHQQQRCRLTRSLHAVAEADAVRRGPRIGLRRRACPSACPRSGCPGRML